MRNAFSLVLLSMHSVDLSHIGFSNIINKLSMYSYKGLLRNARIYIFIYTHQVHMYLSSSRFAHRL